MSFHKLMKYIIPKGPKPISNKTKKYCMNFGVKHGWYAPLCVWQRVGPIWPSHTLSHMTHVQDACLRTLPILPLLFQTLDDVLKPNDDACIPVDWVNQGQGQNGWSQPSRADLKPIQTSWLRFDPI